MMKRIVIAGCRHFRDYERFCAAVDRDLSRIKNEYQLVILCGHCSGTDAMAERYAREHGYGLELYPADWRLGKIAGPARNRRMVEQADYVIAFPSGGPGTQSLVAFAREKGIPIRIHPLKP
jgi:hypothetical protein